MNWRSLGRIYACENYAQTPTPLVMDDRIRVYVAAREDGKSFIRFVDLDINDPTKVIGESGRVLENGAVGAFDSCGQMPSYAARMGHNVDLWYSGWLAPAGDLPYHNATGLVRSVDHGRTFERPYRCDGPVLDRIGGEPYLAVTPCLLENRMWYITGLRWELIAGKYEPIYGIAEASWDGSRWKRDGLLVMPQQHTHECFSRPWVLKIDDAYHMWYCHRSAIDYRDGPNAYRIGYAISPDGLNWTRNDGAFRLERSDWDATMQCYPAVFTAKGKMYMLYNGNTFGKFGFGLAVAE